MAIAYSTLRAAAQRPRVVVAKSITEAQQKGLRSAFLCHSHKDSQLVEGFVNYVKEKGWDVYIDWADTTLPSSPSRETATRIKSKIKSSDLFIFLATENSVGSRWCPWEIGFADGVKPINTILVVPTTDDSGRYHGNEYLQLYRKLDVSGKDRFAYWEPGAEFGTAASAL